MTSDDRRTRAARRELYDAPAESHLAEYMGAILRRWWLVLLVAAMAVALALFASLMMTPQYRATTTLQIQREPLKVVDMQDLLPAESPMDRDFYQTQYELLMSRTLARRVIGRARLARSLGRRLELGAASRRSPARSPRRASAPAPRPLTSAERLRELPR